MGRDTHSTVQDAKNEADLFFWAEDSMLPGLCQRVQILHKRRGCAVDASDLLAGLAPQEVLAFRKSRISDKINS